ncbi:OstA-like protein [Fibrella aquatica]|uniref:OstA-like protein n=1 Tax=Fibrella aquatica TaxID=3242487 RepID=UPI00352169B5
MSKLYVIPLLTCFHFTALAQRQPISPSASKDPVKLEVLPGKAIRITQEEDVRRYVGHVRLRHQEVVLFCDRAAHQQKTSRVYAGGHVLLVQSDSITVKSDSLIYDGLTRQATLLGHVLFQHHKTVLTATRIEYDLSAGLVRYSGKSRFVDGRTILNSTEGWYSTQTGQVAATSLAGSRSSDRTRKRGARHARLPQSTPPESPYEPDYPLRLALTMTDPSANIAPEPESVRTTKKNIRVSPRLTETTRAEAEPTPDESALERVLNRKKRTF